jgi:hypothetical protein
MQPKTLRNWGLVAGVAAMAGSLGVATFTRDPASAPEPPRPIIAAALPNILAPWQNDDEKAGQPAPRDILNLGLDGGDDEATLEDPPATFIVRFADDHPLARAQQLSADGREDMAIRAAERGVRRDRNLRGLCFDHFTAGGVEIVLKPCEAVAADERDAFRREWAEKLSSMPGVSYAEANVVVRPETVQAE